MKTFILVLALAGVALGQVDVGIDTIAGIPGTIDSGQAVVPRVVVRNHTVYPAGPVDVHIKLGYPYEDSVVGFYMPGLAVETLAFGGFVPRGRDSMEAVAWLHCDGDTYPQNDTFRLRFFVRIKDLGLSDLWPSGDTFDSGQVIVPHVRVWNLGNETLNFTIGLPQRLDTITLPPGGDTVMYGDSLTCIPGVWVVSASAIVAGDMHPENNIVTDTFYVRGTILHDVAAVGITEPGWWVDTLGSFNPTGQVKNNGSEAVMFRSFFTILNAGGDLVYADSAQHLIGPGDSTDVSYSPTRITVVGNYFAAESVFMVGDQNMLNDVFRVSFRVVGGPVLGDIGVVRIVAPSGHLPPDSSFIPAAVWKNYSDHRMTYGVFFFIHNKYGVRVYSQWLGENELDGGEEDTLYFVSFNVGNDTGTWCAFCSTAAGGDTNPSNDTLRLWFRVDYPGIEETANGEVRMANSGATVVRGVLVLDAVDSRPCAGHRAELLDITGRKSLDLQAGVNDVRALAPGVYFVREAQAQAQAQVVHKVVIAK